MNRDKRMVKTTIIYFIGNFGSKLLSFFLLPIYTSWLDPEAFGAVDLLVSIVPLIGPVFTLQTTESIFRFMFECKEEDEYKKNISAAFLIYVLGMLAFCITIVPFAMITKLENWSLFAVYFISLYIGIFAQQVLRGFGKSLDYAITGMISTLVQGVANIILIQYVAEKSLLIAPILASLSLFLYAAYKSKLYQYIGIKYLEKSVIKKQLVYATPLIPNQICWWFNGLLGKYVVLHYLGEFANGLLAVATKFPNLLSTITSIYFLAWTENSIIEFDAEDRDTYYSNNLSNLIEFLLYVAAPLIVVIKLYFELMLSNEYKSAFTLVPVLIIGMVFNSIATFLGTIYTASKKTKGAFTTTIYAAVVNVIASFVLIPNVGLVGYAYANLASYLIFAIVRYFSVQKICKIRIEWKKAIIPAMILIMAIVTIDYSIVVNFVVLVILGVIVLLRYFKEFVKLIKR